ncbi:MAG: DinB family protein, partial [Planctomycetales bacterium]|nr:DinB family protein [Planctomycetales bacterium]
MESFELGSTEALSDAALLQGRDQVLQQIAWTRQYTLQLLESISPSLWYHRPDTASTHVAWQVGHLAVSQYGLMLFRQRGRASGDMELMPGWLRKQFGRGTQPAESAQGMPQPEELLARL